MPPKLGKKLKLRPPLQQKLGWNVWELQTLATKFGEELRTVVKVGVSMGSTDSCVCLQHLFDVLRGLAILDLCSEGTWTTGY